MIKSSYKKLKIWQKGMEVAKKSYELSKKFPTEEKYVLTSQIRRSAISIPSNIAEGSQRVSDKEFSNFILIARGSLVELETQFLLAKEFCYITNELSTSFFKEIDELDKMLFAFYRQLTAQSSSLKAV